MVEFGSNKPDEQLTLDNYKVASFGTFDGYDVLACAFRQGGIGFVRLAIDPQQHSGAMILEPGLDVVDVCVLRSEPPNLATVALTYERKIVLVQEKGTTFEFAVVTNDRLRGTPYRIVIAQGEIFVLTSAGLYGFPGLAKQLLAKDLATHQLVKEANCDALDVSVASDNFLLIIEPDRVVTLDARLWLETSPDSNANTENVFDYRPDLVMRKMEYMAVPPSVVTAISALN